MEFDAYQRCVGGCDKKIKFCCGTKIVGDLNDIFSAMEADQKAAALDRVNRAIAKQGDKDCLLATKVSVLIQLNQFEPARQIVDLLLSRNPVNPVALGQKTTLLAVEGDAEKAVDCLQLALEHYDRTISRGVMNAIRIVGALLHSQGNPLAARAHLTLYASLSAEPDNEVTQLLFHSYSDPETPVLLKHDHDLPVAPEGGSWSAEYNGLRGNVQRGRWRSSLQRLRELDEAHPGQPILRKALAVMEGRIGDPESQSAAWRRYAETQGVPTEESIEAAAIAMVLKGDTLDDTQCTQRLVTFPIKDAQTAIEQLAKAPRASGIKDFRAPEGTPPPKAVFSLVDRAILGPDDEIKLELIPNVLGTAIVYGRETDREPRIEIEGYQGHGLEQAIELVREAVGSELAAEPTENEELASVNVIDLLFSVRWFLLNPVSPERRRDLLDEKVRTFLIDTWPHLPLSRFEGKTALEAAKDPANHLSLLAWLLMTEEVLDAASFGWIDLNPLRAKLGLPERVTINPSNINLDRLPIYRFSKLDFDALTEPQIDRALYFAKITGHSYLAYRAATAKLERGENLDANTRFQLLSTRAHTTPNLTEGRKDLQEMETLASEAQVEEPVFLLMYLEWSLQRGQSDLVEKLMGIFQRKYRNDPAVTTALGRLLMRMGIISPDGRPANAQGHSHSHSHSHAPAEAAPAKTASPSLWTPGAQAAPEAPAQGSKLWLPGMD